MDVALLLFLIFLNALFAMSEMALTASRKARLQVMVEAGDSGASHAMALHDEPTKWLSVVQVVIAEHGLRCAAERVHLAQHAERIGSAVDEIAGEPEAIGCRRKADQREQFAQLCTTALDITDRVVRHGIRE